MTKFQKNEKHKNCTTTTPYVLSKREKYSLLYIIYKTERKLIEKFFSYSQKWINNQNHPQIVENNKNEISMMGNKIMNCECVGDL